MIDWFIGFNFAFNTERPYIDGLAQERRNSSALAMELRLSCTNSSILPPPRHPTLHTPHPTQTHNFDESLEKNTLDQLT